MGAYLFICLFISLVVHGKNLTLCTISLIPSSPFI